MVLDLNTLNQSVNSHMFKIETTQITMAAICQEHFLATVDLKEAYLNICISQMVLEVGMCHLAHAEHSPSSWHFHHLLGIHQGAGDNNGILTSEKGALVQFSGQHSSYSSQGHPAGYTHSSTTWVYNESGGKSVYS